jgi:hypothetical protein
MAITHEQKWVAGNAGKITGNVAGKPLSVFILNCMVIDNSP